MKDKIQPHRENNVKSYIRSDDVNLKQKDTIQLFANMEFKLLHGFVFVRNSDTSIKNTIELSTSDSYGHQHKQTRSKNI